MQYFSKYIHCQKYYNLYNYKTNNNEYMRFYLHYTINGCLYKYILDGVFHHDSKPAIAEYIEQNIITNLSYYKNGKRHRVGRPAVIYNDICILDKSVYVYDK